MGANPGISLTEQAYTRIEELIVTLQLPPGGAVSEGELCAQTGFGRTPVREALQRLETQSLLNRDGRSLFVSSLDHNQIADLYVVRAELEGLAAKLAARTATNEEQRVLVEMVEQDFELVDDPSALARANRRFHKQIHLSTHNRYLVQQLDLVHRSMALMATTSLAADGRGLEAMKEHQAIVTAIVTRDEDAAYQALKHHLSSAFVTRLKQKSEAT